jgi:hypothetical protein
MATALTVQQEKGPFDTITAGLLDITLSAADVTGNTFVCTGREKVYILNPAGGSTYTVTITSQVDEKGRTGDITAYSMAAGKFIVWNGGLTNSPGWKVPATGVITITASNAAVLIGVGRLPTGASGL